MKFFAGIVPPEDIYNRIVQIQHQYGDNRLEPHITLRPPVSPADADEWVNTITTIAASSQPFTIQLPGTGYFGKRVLFVSVEAEPLNGLYDRLIPALKQFEPKEPRQGPEKYHPHLTLGRAWCGFTPDDFKNMQQQADDYLSGSNISFEATHIRIYHKAGHQGRYQPYRDVPLGA